MVPDIKLDYAFPVQNKFNFSALSKRFSKTMHANVPAIKLDYAFTVQDTLNFAVQFQRNFIVENFMRFDSLADKTMQGNVQLLCVMEPRLTTRI